MNALENGSGRPVLILHGGGGPQTVLPIASALTSVHTIVPTHPGWNGTARPESLTTIRELATTYLRWLGERGLRDVAVVGSSIGGWIGAEMAAQDQAGIVTGLVLVDTVGIEVVGEPIRDFFALDARGVADYSFHDADRFYVDPASLSDEDVQTRAANMATMRVFAGDPYMHDPTLASRLGGIDFPVTVVWGDSDRIVTPEYGRAFAKLFTHSTFQLVENAGHLPQIERPEATMAVIDGFLRG